MSAELRLALKALIVEACDKDCDPASITDDELLFGPEAPLQLVLGTSGRRASGYTVEPFYP